MPSKCRQQSIKRRKIYRANEEKTKSQARIFYSQNAEKVKHQSTIRRSSDSTSRKKNAIRSVERMAKRRRDDFEFRERNRLNTNTRLRNNACYRERNRANVKRRLDEDAEYRERNRANVKRRLDEDDEYRERNRANVKRRLDEDHEYKERNRANVKRRLYEDHEYKERNKANIKRRLQNDSEYKERNRVNTKRRLETDEKYQQRNRELASITKKRRLKMDAEYRAQNNKKANVNTKRRLQNDNQYRERNKARARDRSEKVRKLQRLKRKNSKKHVPTLQQKYWIRRSKLLAAAREKRCTLILQRKMSAASNVFLLDVRLLFNKAQQRLKNGNQKVRYLHGKLAGRVKEWLEALPSETCPTVCDIATAFNCSRSHSSSSEPYYWEQAYKLIPADFIVPIDENGQANIFEKMNQNVSKPVIIVTDSLNTDFGNNPVDQTFQSSKSTKSWQCNDQLCHVTKDNIDGLLLLLRKIAKMKPLCIGTFYIKANDCNAKHCLDRLGHFVNCSSQTNCSSLLQPARILSCHFPALRSMVRRVYDVRRLSICLQTIKSAMASGDYNLLVEAIRLFDAAVAAIFASSADSKPGECAEVVNVINEKTIMDEFGKQLRLVAELRDTYATECCSICEQFGKQLYSLKALDGKNGYDTQKMSDIIDLLYQNKTKHEDVEAFLRETFVCSYCADKLKANKDIARSCFNKLAVVPTPECIKKLNLFERTLIKFCMTCITVVRLGQVTNKSRPANELTAALKGRIAHLPVDVSANAKFLPENLLNVDSLVLLVGGQPTKHQKIWTSVVDLQKVHAALNWLRLNNHLYKDVPAYTVDDIKRIIDERQGGSEKQCRSITDSSMLKKLDEASKSFLYENFSVQPLHGDYPADVTMDYQLQKINGPSTNIFDSDLDLKAYPELFPTGENGMRDATRAVKIGTSDFIKSRLMNKDPKFRLNINYLFHNFQVQEISNMCHSVGHMLRSVTGNSLSAQAFVERLRNKDGELQNNMFSLMANLRGSKEYFAKLAMDIRSMIKHLGPPTLFLTCNTAEWFSEPFIEYLKHVNKDTTGIEAMTPAELCSMDPVSVSIHFQKKWDAIFKNLIKSKQKPLFGEVLDHFWRVEYQTRGAPHVHCVLWVKDAPVLGKNTPDEVKEYIERHITCCKPDPSESPTLCNLVSQFQTHKCNKYCTKSYKKNGRFYRKCRFGFPRPVKIDTHLNDVTDCLAMAKNNQPRKRLYHLKRSKEETHINDYNAPLLLANQANVDVQFIGHLGSRLPFYITDYMTKHERSEQDDMWRDIFSCTKSLGQNAMSFLLKSVSSRQVGANEAADRLLSHKLYSKSRQTRFADLRPPDKAKRVLRSVTELEKLVQADPHSEQIYQLHWIIDIYPNRPDVLEDCSLHELLGWYERDYSSKENNEELKVKNHNLSLRRRRDTPYIVTHQTVNPRKDDESRELYFYYLLKLFKPWRKEIELRDANKSYTETFFFVRDLFPQMGSYHDNNIKISEQEQEMEKQIKDRAEELKNKADTDDLEDELGAMNGCAVDNIKSAMQELSDIHIANVRRIQSNNEELSEAYNSLNSDQRRVVDNVVSAICQQGVQVRQLISGQGGTGKSRVIHVLSQLVSKQCDTSSLSVVVAAPTGLSAFNISASTIHRVLCLPVEHGKPADYIPLNTEQLTSIRATMRDLKLLIIDEVSMVSSLTLLYIHLRLTEIMCSHELFGGVSVVFFADLLQLPPVKGNQPFIKVSQFEAKQRIGSIGVLDLWQTLDYDELTINMRQKGDEAYIHLLTNARVGYLTHDQINALSSRLIANNRRANIAEIIETYQNLVTQKKSPLILMPTTALCKEVNEAMIQTTGNETVIVTAVDTLDTIVIRHVLSKVEAAYRKVAQDASRSGGLEMNLQLSVGARVMLKRNKDVDAGLVNGSLGHVTALITSKSTNGLLEVSSVEVKFDNLDKPIKLIRDSSTFEVLKGIFYTRKQFPLMLAFAITIHKSQGLSLNSALVDAGSSTFGSGMMYVALSRVTSLCGLHLIDFDSSKLKCDKKAVTEYNRLRATYQPHLGSLMIPSEPAAESAKTSNCKIESYDNKKHKSKSMTDGYKVDEEFCNEQGDKKHVEVYKNLPCSSSQSSIQFLYSQSQSIFQYCHIQSLNSMFQKAVCDRMNLCYATGEIDVTPAAELSTAEQLTAYIYEMTGTAVNVQIHQIIGDGNCLFRALSLAITGTQRQHELIRGYIVNHMLNYTIQSQMKRMFHYRSDANSVSYNTHLANMLNLGVWGTEQEIASAANLFECSIHTFSRVGTKMSIQHFSPHFVLNAQCNSTCKHQTVYLVNSSGIHYNLATVQLTTYLEE